MTSLRPRALFLSAALAAGLLAGCTLFQAKQDPSQFYVLNGLPASAAPATPSAPDVAIGVYTPDLPAYLDCPQIVTRLGSNQVALNEFQRWAEPVNAGFARALVQNIALYTGSNRIALFPLTRTFSQEFEVYLLIFQFDGQPGGTVTLRARWRVTGPDGRPVYLVRDSAFTRDSALSPNPYSAYVDTLSLLVGDLAKDIVAAIPDAQTAEAADKAKDAQDAKDAEAKTIAMEAAAVPPPVATNTTIPSSPAPTPSTTTTTP
jgi:uncharacterized protein